MADDLTSNPWVIDSTGTKSSQELRITRVAWKNATTLNHTVLIVDGGGHTIFEDFASGATYNVSEPIGRVFTGFAVSTLQSGKLYVYHDLKPRRD
jgi:hypothetical protein